MQRDFSVEIIGDRLQITYTPSYYELFQGNGDALNIYTYVMLKPAHYEFRRAEFQNHFSLSKERVRKALNVLKSAGLLETYPVKNHTGISGSKYQFYTLSHRVKPKTSPKTGGPQKGTDAYKKTTPKHRNPPPVAGCSDGTNSGRPETMPISTPGGIQGGRGARVANGVSAQIPEPAPEQNPDPGWYCEPPKPIPTPSTTPPLSGVNVEQALRFLKRFDGLHTFQTFSDNKKNPALAKVLHGDQHIFELDALNQQGAGIYLTINETNGKGRKADDVERVRAIFVDLDGSPVAPVYKYRPHLVVETSPGKFHAYWFTQNMPLDAFRQMQKILIEKFSGDKHVKDLSRVMRIPGFYHMKDKPFLSRIVYERHHPAFTFAELVELFPPPPRKQWSKPKNAAKTFHHPNEAGTEYRGGYGAAKGDRNQSTMRIVCGMIKRRLPWDRIENEAFMHGRACQPPLPDAEIRTVLNSCRRYA